MKLSQYAKNEGLTYRGAYRRWKHGQIPGAYLDDSGHVVVPDPKVENLKNAAVYARVSSNKQKKDLERQADRMVSFANAAGYRVVKVVKEVGSGVNDHRVKLTRLLESDEWGTLVVEHKDRLSRVGFEWFRVLLARQGKSVVVANEAQDDTSDLMADFTSIIYSFATRLYGLHGAKSRANATVRAFKTAATGNDDDSDEPEAGA